jgi:outer membrane protein W
LGVYYRVWNTWHVVGSFSAAQITSRLETNTAGVVRKSDVSFNPHVIVLSVGYSF